VGAEVDHLGRPEDPVGLEPRNRIGQRRAAVEDEPVSGPRRTVLGHPDVVASVGRLEPDPPVGIGQRHLDVPGERRPEHEPGAVGP
jgi:hypothetical protein